MTNNAAQTAPPPAAHVPHPEQPNAPGAGQPAPAGWSEVDRGQWEDAHYQYQARVVAKAKPLQPPPPRRVLRVENGDVEVEPIAVGGGVRVAARGGYVSSPRMVPLRRVSVVAVVSVLLAVWFGYAWGSSVGRAEMAREIIRAGVHRLADRPALVDTIEDASGWDADTREAERQRGRDERGR